MLVQLKSHKIEFSKPDQHNQIIVGSGLRSTGLKWACGRSKVSLVASSCKNRESLIEYEYSRLSSKAAQINKIFLLTDR